MPKFEIKAYFYTKAFNMGKIEASWKVALADEFKKDYFKNLVNSLRQAKETGKTIYPPGFKMFNAFDSTPFKQVKIVILGQDPYHNPGQAMGLSFSVPQGIKIPPSLRNIYKELVTDIGINMPQHGDLSSWANQGIFLLNAMLSVEKKQPSSHKNFGWQHFTDAAIHTLSEKREHLVFMLWGAFAGRKRVLIDTQKHLVLTSAHPSPFSAHRGFLGNQHFSQANTYLEEHGIQGINWQI